MTTWQDRVRGIWARIAGRRPAAAIYQELRSRAFGVDPASVRTEPGEPWNGATVAAMELALDGATATILAVADGTVSMYLSTGGGVIGAGEHVAVRAEGRRFRSVLADARSSLTPTAEFPLPVPGQVRFHAVLGPDRATAVASETLLRGGRHPLSPLYAAGQDLLTEIRLATEPVSA
jgi:hypothetical protein